MKKQDVVIIGGGLAGLTLALQLRKRHPGLGVSVFEAGSRPLPQGTHKVGESTVEIAAHYFAEVLELRGYLRREHLVKAGLRYFFPSPQSADLSTRFELGSDRLLPLETYNLDRAAFERELWWRCAHAQVDLHEDTQVHAWEQTQGSGQNRHCLFLGEGKEPWSCRWLVDASGRRSFVKRQLGLGRRLDHQVNAAWFRVERRIDVAALGSDPTWRQRLPAGFRRAATNHLVGRGYWVWLIPLPGGATSVGIVAEAEAHAFDGYRRQEDALSWLERHEPALHTALVEAPSAISNFRVAKDYAYGAARVFSQDGWFLTGESAVFVDALLSPASDLIAIANTLITESITAERAGEASHELIEHCNEYFLDLADFQLSWYRGQYDLLGNAPVYTAKALWNFLLYMSVSVPLFWANKLHDRAFANSIRPELMRFRALSDRMESTFQRWDQLEPAGAGPGHLDMTRHELIMRLQRETRAGLSDAELRRVIRRNVALCEQTAEELWERLGSRGEAASVPAAEQALAEFDVAADLVARRSVAATWLEGRSA